MTDEGITVVIDNGELVDIATQINGKLDDILEELRFDKEYLEYQREQIRIQNSISLSILVFSGAILGALIFRHLRK